MFKVKDLIWAKVNPFPHWPCQVTGITKDERNELVYTINFLGERSYATVLSRDAYSFEEYKDKFNPSASLLAKYPTLKKGLKDAEKIEAQNASKKQRVQKEKEKKEVRKISKPRKSSPKKSNKVSKIPKSKSPRLREQVSSSRRSQIAPFSNDEHLLPSELLQENKPEIKREDKSPFAMIDSKASLNAISPIVKIEPVQHEDSPLSEGSHMVDLVQQPSEEAIQDQPDQRLTVKGKMNAVPNQSLKYQPLSTSRKEPRQIQKLAQKQFQRNLAIEKALSRDSLVDYIHPLSGEKKLTEINFTLQTLVFLLFSEKPDYEQVDSHLTRIIHLFNVDILPSAQQIVGSKLNKMVSYVQQRLRAHNRYVGVEFLTMVIDALNNKVIKSINDTNALSMIEKIKNGQSLSNASEQFLNKNGQVDEVEEKLRYRTQIYKLLQLDMNLKILSGDYSSVQKVIMSAIYRGCEGIVKSWATVKEKIKAQGYKNNRECSSGIGELLEIIKEQDQE